jgi:putative ABC transport system permease protein
MVAIFAVLVLAALAIAVGLSVIDQGTRQVDDAARDANVAHLVVAGDRQGVEQAAADPELTDTSGPYGAANVVFRFDGGGEDVRLVALDDPEIAVSRPLQRGGRWLDPDRDDEVVLDHSAAVDLGVEPGDQVTFVRGADTTTFTVVGDAIDLTDCGFPQCDPIRAFVSTSGLARVGGPEYWLLHARLADASLADAAASRLLTTVSGIGGTESWPDTRGDFLAVDRIFGRFITVFGLFVLVASCIVVAGSMVVRMTARRREIGLLEAVGCTNRQVTVALLVEHLLIGLAAAVVGWLLAGFLSPALQIGVADVIGASSPAWPLQTLVVTGVVFALIVTAATVVPAWRAGRVPVSDVVRDVPPQTLSRLARRIAGLPRRLGALGVHEAAARPGRSLLAALAVALAVVSAIVANGFIATIGEAIDSPARVGDAWDAAVAPAEGTSPQSVEAVLAATPEVASWYSETSRRSTIGDEVFLTQAIGGDPEAARMEIGAGRPIEQPGEAIIGYGMVNRFGIGVGDTVSFFAGAVPLTVTVTGWYRETEDSGEILLYRLEQLQAADPGVVPEIYRVTAVPGTSPQALADALSGRLGDAAEIEPFEVDVEALDVFSAVLWLVALVVGAVAAANLLSVMLTSTRESARTIGVEQALGFTPRQLIGHGAVAAAAVAVLGAVVGVPAGLWLLRVMGDAVTSQMGIGPGFGTYPPALTVVLFAIVAVAVAAVLGAFAARRLATQPASDLVRWD